MRGVQQQRITACPILEALEPRVLLDGAAAEQAAELFSVSPAFFVENQGQWADPSVRYVHNGDGANVAMTDSGPVFQVFRQVPREGADGAPESDLPPGLGPDLPDPGQYDTQMLQFSASFLGASTVAPTGLAPSDARFNYFVGDQADWRSDVPAYEKVAYEGLYDGIDLVTWGLRSHLKYEFHVAPGADWQQIQVHYEGIQGLSIGEDGSLRVALGGEWGDVVDDAPVVYQMVDGQKITVAAGFRLIDSDTYAFALTGPYDPKQELVIDPDLAWSTYLGGSGKDIGQGIAVDSSGNALVTGIANSTNFSGASNVYKGGDWDAFVAKVSSGGSLVWATYLGGSSDDWGLGIAVDSSGNALVTGLACSTNFSGANNVHKGGGLGAFVAKVSSGGSLVWATYLGGSGGDVGRGIAVDSSGNALVTGETSSTNFSGASNAYKGGGEDAFVAKVSSGGSLVWATYLGGSGMDRGAGIAVDSSGNALVTGGAASTNFSGASNAYKGGSFDAFVAKVSSGGSLVWATYLGGSGEDWGVGIAVDSSGNTLVTGETSSTNFSGASNTYKGGSYDAFVAKVSSGGSLVWATYLGGSGGDVGRGIAVDSSGNTLVTGETSSTNFSGASNAYKGGGDDAFVAKVSSGGSLVWATYLGGSGMDGGLGIAVDSSGNALVTGYTDSTDFSDTNNAYKGGSYDAFVAKFTVCGTVTMRLPGSAVSYWLNCHTANSVEESQWSDTGGDWMGGTATPGHPAEPVYSFYLPPKQLGSAQLASFSVSVYGKGYFTTLYIGDDNKGDLPSPAQENGPYVYTGQAARGLLADVTDSSGNVIASRLDVRLDASYFFAWYDVKEVEVTYSYSGIDTQLLYGFQVAYAGYLALAHFKTDVVQGLWNANVAERQFYLETLGVISDTLISGVIGTMFGPLWGAIINGAYDVYGLQDRYNRLMGVTDWTLFWTSYDTASMGGWAPSRTLDVPPHLQAAADGMRNLAGIWANSMADNTISNQGTSSEAAQINSAIDTAVNALTLVKSDLTRAAKNAMWEIYKTRGSGEPGSGSGDAYAESCLKSMLPLLRYSYDLTSCCYAEDSYLVQLIDALDSERMNVSPTDIALSNSRVAENQPQGTVVGLLSGTDPDPGQSATLVFELVSGYGDNAKFSIDPATKQLKTAAAFDYESKSSYSIMVRATDTGSPPLTHDEPFTISVINVNEPPTDISLSNGSVFENQPAGTVVGTLGTVDPDSGDAWTYRLVPDPGGDDNAKFRIIGNVLKTAVPFDYETKNLYKIRVQSTDLGGLPTEKVFMISITDVDDNLPVVTGISLNGVLERGASGIDPSGAGVRSIAVTFSEPVNLGDGAVTVQKFPTGVAITPFIVAGSGTNEMIIALGTGSVVDTWLEVKLNSAAIADLAGNALDGEPKVGGSGRGYIYNLADLPTGDGWPGGDAVFYVGSLRGDFNGDRYVTADDKAGFVAAWYAKSLDADFRGVGFGVRRPDGKITLGDIDGFTSVYLGAVAAGRHLDPLPAQGGGLAAGVIELPPLPQNFPQADILREAAGQLAASHASVSSALKPGAFVPVQTENDSADDLRLRLAPLPAGDLTDSLCVLRL